MLGYLKNEAATRETLDQDGWLWTGDVGQLIDGKVYIVDRKKELIKVRGWQVSPAEVEAVALEHPEIADAAVIGIELPNGSGEIPRAYVVLRKASNLSSEEIQTFIGKSLARYKVPSQVLFVDSIPKNATGKILRRIPARDGRAGGESRAGGDGVGDSGAATVAEEQAAGHAQGEREQGVAVVGPLLRLAAHIAAAVVNSFVVRSFTASALRHLHGNCWSGKRGWP